MDYLELLKLNPFTLIVDTGARTDLIPNIRTIEEAIIVPKLDRDFALRILSAYPNICSSENENVSTLQGILDRNSFKLWDELTEELSNTGRYKPIHYTMFSLHKFRREFIGKQTLDIKSQTAFMKWSGGRTFRMFSDHVHRGGEYKLIGGVVHISCSLVKSRTNFLSYCQSILPVPLKYSPSNKSMYNNRHKLTTSHSHSSFFTRFTGYKETYRYLNTEGLSEFENLIKEENRFIEAVEDYEKRRRQAIRPSKNSKPNIEIIADLPDWDESVLSQSQINELEKWNPDESVLSQCQFCYRYETIKPKTTPYAWHCNSHVCKSAYRKWVDRLKLKGIKLKDYWVI
jgi:hypothetical protein